MKMPLALPIERRSFSVSFSGGKKSSASIFSPYSSVVLLSYVQPLILALGGFAAIIT